MEQAGTQEVSHPIYSTAETFAINILAEDQVDLSQRFSRPMDDRFNGIAVTEGSGGLPLLDGAVESLRVTCENDSTSPGHFSYT